MLYAKYRMARREGFCRIDGFEVSDFKDGHAVIHIVRAGFDVAVPCAPGDVELYELGFSGFYRSKLNDILPKPKNALQ